MPFSKDLKNKATRIWEEGYHHPFVQGIGQGTLDKKSFQFYLLQDYQYLLEYAKVYALGAIKADTTELLTEFSSVQNSILSNEMQLHKQYMKQFQITDEEVNNSRPSLFNKTYTANMLAVGQTGDAAEIIATIFPCGWTYYDYACRLKKDYPQQLEDNYYRSWIETYASDDFYNSFAWFYPELDRLVEHKSESEKKHIQEIFVDSVQFEYLFWDMSYKQAMSVI